MRYSVQWRTKPKPDGTRDVEEWTAFDSNLTRKKMLSSRKYLFKSLKHEVRIFVGDTEIEVEDDDQ